MSGSRQIEWAWNGTPITVGLDGCGHGADVLLLPALSSISTRAEMRPLLQRLAPAAHAVAVDWPGFGEQGRAGVAWTPDALSGFLDHLMEAVLPEVRLVVAAGHAATYALWWAAAHPGRLERLVLVAPTWRGPLPTMAGGDRPLFARLRRAVGSPVLGPLLYRANVNRLMVRMMVAGHVYADPRTLRGDLLAGKRRVIDAPGARFGSVAFVTGGLDRVADRDGFLGLARRADAPMLVVYGAQTPRKSRAEMEALGALPHVHLHRLPHGKLGVHEEFPDEVAPVVQAFLLPTRNA